MTEIYQSTYGDSCWENVDGWEENNKDMMQWYGLLLDRGGNIVKLRLRDNGLEGFLPPSVADLKSLMILDLSKNYIEGRVPDLSPLKELRKLCLNRNRFSGECPPELGDLSMLEKLCLNSNKFDGTIPEDYADLSNIRHLDLGRNNLSGTIPGELGDLVSLCTLNLNDNFFSGPVPTTFTRLTNLGEECDAPPRRRAPDRPPLSLSFRPRAAARRVQQAL